jgi:two-component system, NtrC family, response regulator AtoC
MQTNQQAGPEIVLIGNSPAIRRTRMQLESAALADAPVLICGESGTGKDLVARLLHAKSSRAAQPFVKVNCPAIPEQLFESELFGYEPGAFTGANQSKPGKFEVANGGTIFLDEIGELAMPLQSKLLQALQDFRFVRLGGIQDKKVDVRVICATNRDLAREIETSEFRADLFYRINVLQIAMPSLRERAEDIPVLMEHFIQLHSEQFGRVTPPLSHSIMQVLEAYHWPGNIRELENLAKRYVVIGGEDNILSSLREKTDSNPFATDAIDVNTPLRIQTKKALRHLERRIILQVLQAHKWNRRKTARSLDISYRALLYKIKEAGVPPLRTVKTSTHVKEE